MKIIQTLFLLLGCYYLIAQSSENVIDGMIMEGISDWKIPGLAVTIVKDGETVFKKAYGVTDIYSEHKVDDETIFMMGSTTKAITALAIGILVDRESLHWDDKVITHLPYFKVNDIYITNELTIRDLLTHRAGMPNTDMLWASGLPANEVLSRMQFVKPTYSLRSDFIYQNVMYLAAGKVIEQVSGISWTEFLHENIFEPLGMTRTFAHGEEGFSTGNYVLPHNIIKGKLDTITHLSTKEIAPAGDIWSSISDMETWLKFWTNGGLLNGNEIVSKKTFDELFKPNSVIPKEKFYPTTKLTYPKWTTYGLGWFQQDYKHHDLDFHTGSLPGLIAILGLVREQNFGVYVFGNVDHAELRHAIWLKAIDLFLDKDNSRDWHDETFELYGKLKADQQEKQNKTKKARVVNTTPSLGLNQYEGTYLTNTLGALTILRHGATLQFKLNKTYQGILEHWHYDVFNLVIPNSSGINLIQFQLNNKGSVHSLKAFGEEFLKSP